MNVANEVLGAEERIRPYIRETILDHSPYLSRAAGAHVYCKLENLQHTGSFKVRGAMNKIMSLSHAERSQGVVAASTGNHGAAVAYCLEHFDAPGIIFVPERTDSSKVQRIELLGAEVRTFGTDTVEAEVHARAFAARNNMTYVSPYNDLQVIGGQGTIGVELVRQIDRMDAVFASVGGGGLISGIAGYIKRVRPDVRVIGCSPENSPVMARSVKAGRILDLPSLPTLSDGTAGGVEAGAITFELCRDLVDEFVTVTEGEIRDHLLLYMREHRMLIEGAAAVAVAAFMKLKERFAGGNVIIVICGANIDLDTLRSIMEG
jgi:threonine dehydratase